MSTRRTLFTFGALVAAVALLAPAMALAQTEVTIGPANPATYNKLEVAWLKASPNPDGYRVYYGETDIGNAAKNADEYEDVDSSEAKVTLTGLDDVTVYYASVATLKEDADGKVAVGVLIPADELVGFMAGDPGASFETTMAPMPSPPRNVTAMGGDGTFTLSWDAAYTGGNDLTIKEYRVQKREVAGTLTGDWIPPIEGAAADDTINAFGKKVDSDMTMFTFEDLENGITYEGRVRAINSADRESDPTTRDGDAPDDDATAMVGDEDDMEGVPALPLFGILALFGGLLTAGRARLRRGSLRLTR